MALSAATLKQFQDFAAKHDLKAFEDAWITAIADDTSDAEGLLEAISALESQGQFQKAIQFLHLLLDAYLESRADDEALLVLHRLAKLAGRDARLRDRYLTVLRRKYADHPGLDALVRESGIENELDVGAAADRLQSYLAFRPGAYVEHPAGWGVGTVRSVDPENATVTIDFEDMKGHELEMAMATSITRHLDSDDFRAMRFDRMDQLKAMAESDPVELVKKVVRSRARESTVRDLRHVLTDGVIPAKDWSKWWTKTRALVKRDGNLKISTGNNPTLELVAVEQAFSDQTLVNVAQLKDLPRKIKYVRELFIELETHPETRPALVVAAGVLAKTARAEKAKFPGAMLSVALMLEKIAQVDDQYVVPEDLILERVLDDPWQLVDVLGTVPIAADRKEILQRVHKRFPEEWPELFERLMYIGEGDVNDHILREFTSTGAFDRLTRVIFDLLKKFREHRSAFLWFVRTTLKGNLHKALPHPELRSLLERTLLLHTYVNTRFLQTNDPELRKEMRNIEKILTAQGSSFVKKAVKECAIEDAVDFYNIVRGSRSLPDDVKDNVVAGLLRTRPEIARERARAEEREAPIIDERVIYVTAAGYARYEAEFNKLVNDEIPKNAREIGNAASFGDLSENAEWTAALEKQSNLTQKAEDMRIALEKARVIDLTTTTDEYAQVGCRVEVENLATNAIESFTLLGPWDANMEKGIISYMSPLGRALLGKTPGEEIEVVLPAGLSNYRVKRISIASAVGQEQGA